MFDTHLDRGIVSKRFACGGSDVPPNLEGKKEGKKEKRNIVLSGLVKVEAHG